MTPGALMRRAALVVLAQASMLGLGFACATAPTLEGRRESQRDAIHARHTWCMQEGDAYAHAHGVDAWRYLQCDRESRRECLAAALEAHCDQWQSGGL